MLSIKMTFLLLRFGALKRKPEGTRPMDTATMNKVLDYAVRNGADSHFRAGTTTPFRVSGELALNLSTDTLIQAGLDQVKEYDTFCCAPFPTRCQPSRA